MMPAMPWDGFTGQRLVAVARPEVARALRRPLTAELLPTDVGHFPRASGHERRRPDGSPQAILIACLRGAGWLEVGARRHAIGPDRIAIVPPGEPHAYGADPHQPWTISWLHLAGRQVAPWLARLGVGPEQPVIPLHDRSAFATAFEPVLAILERGVGEPDLLRAATATWHLLGTLATARPTAVADPVRLAMDYLEAHLDASVRADDLALVAGLSTSHLTARFRAVTGHPPLDWHLRRRMRHAAELLDASDEPVSRIAARVGYEDPFYFSRRFRVVHGVGPMEYRARRSG